MMSDRMAQRLMDEFAVNTGLTGVAVPRRYLWTDAFALCNYLGLYRRTQDERYLQFSKELIRQVHHILGRHRPGSSQQGWISGLTEAEGEQHPTRGGLRIGKKLNERLPHEVFDRHLEWERDGQYFHYLTKWMHALNRAHQEMDDPQCLEWAIELAVVAHKAFAYESLPDGSRRMYWKMSIDLSRPLVDSMGQHDPLDGLVSGCELKSEAERSGAQHEALNDLISDYKQICTQGNWATEDPLGIGGLLDSLIRLLLAGVSLTTEFQKLITHLMQEIRFSLQYFTRLNQLGSNAGQRLAFRELGLSLGLRGLELLSSRDKNFSGPLSELLGYLPLAEEIESFWSEPAHRLVSTWLDHSDINSVMLATSLDPEGYFGMRCC